MNPFGFKSGSCTMTESENSIQPTLHWRALAEMLENLVINFAFQIFFDLEKFKSNNFAPKS